MMYRSKPCLPFFSSVVKNVASPNIEIKKLVYIYLLHFAESEPDLALLSINTIQKSLSDQNPQVRAMALRVMSGIRVPVISQIVSLAIKKGLADMSPYVRKAAAFAIPKCYRLDPNLQPQLLDYISALLGDKQYFVVGPAVVAFLEVCPERIDLIHKHYRSLVRKLIDMDEWSQIASLRLLTYYSRKCFPRRTRRRRKSDDNDFYEHEGTNAKNEEPENNVHELDTDQEVLIKACKPLLSSRNSSVVVGSVRCLLAVGTPADLDAAVSALMALLRCSGEMKLVVMYNIVLVCMVQPTLFTRYVSHFLIKVHEGIEIIKLKLEVLTLVFQHSKPNIRQMILSELENFAHSNNLNLIQESVQAIGRCAQNDSSASSRCLALLLQLVSSQDGQLVAESLTVIRHLIQRDPDKHVQTVIRLAKNLDHLTNPQARATVIWLVGESTSLSEQDTVAPDVLRILAKGFADESETAKLQILLLAAKAYLHHLLRGPDADLQTTGNTTNAKLESSHENLREANASFDGWGDHSETKLPTRGREQPLAMLWDYIIQLTRYDISYDLRDRARMYQALLADPSSTQLASLVLLAPKPVPHVPSPSENLRNFLLGSTSLLIGTSDITGYEGLPNWVREGDEPDPKLREEPSTADTGGKAGHSSPGTAPAAAELDRAVQEKGLARVAAPAKDKNLDDWLNEESESEEEEGSTDEETGSENISGGEYEEVTDSEGEERAEDRRLLVQ